MQELIHLVYASAAAQKIDKGIITSILKVSVTHNYSSNITGMLLYAEGSFIQLLEGPRQEVQSLYEDIKKDSRHTNIVLLYEEEITTRYFGEWSMGLADVKLRDLIDIPGCRDFIESGDRLAAVSPVIARRLLEGFMHGKWRRHIE